MTLNLRLSEVGAAEVSRPFRLWHLPQELQDLVFELAYPDQVDLRVIFKSEFDQDQAEQRKRAGKSYVAPAFLPLKVNEWLVCKRYFFAAARAWMSGQSFALPNHTSRIRACTAAFMFHKCGLYEDFGRYADISSDFCFLLEYASCHALRYLTIRVSWDDFPACNGNYAWESVFPHNHLDGALERSELAKVSKLNSLTSINLVSLECTFATTANEKHNLMTNATNLETRLRQRASQQQYPTEPFTQAVQKYMYRRSKVLRCPTLPAIPIVSGNRRDNTHADRKHDREPATASSPRRDLPTTVALDTRAALENKFQKSPDTFKSAKKDNKRKRDKFDDCESLKSTDKKTLRMRYQAPASDHGGRTLTSVQDGTHAGPKIAPATASEEAKPERSTFRTRAEIEARRIVLGQDRRGVLSQILRRRKRAAEQRMQTKARTIKADRAAISALVKLTLSQHAVPSRNLFKAKANRVLDTLLRTLLLVLLFFVCTRAEMQDCTF